MDFSVSDLCQIILAVVAIATFFRDNEEVATRRDPDGYRLKTLAQGFHRLRNPLHIV